MPSISTTDSTSSRFWSKVKKTTVCWEWTAYRDKTGYGFFYLNEHSRPVRAHRVSWMLSRGSIPKGLFVCHKCDNPSCVRPKHLFLGNNLENMRDAKHKGRLASGENHGARLHPERVARGIRNGKAKLTDKKVLEIRKEREFGITLKSLAIRYSVSLGQISLIVAGKQWAHVGGVLRQKES